MTNAIETIDVPIEATRRVLEDTFAATTMAREEASIIARALIDAELAEVPTHGFLRVPSYLQGLRSGRYNPMADIRVVVDKPLAALIDADNALGYRPAWLAAHEAARRADEHGIGVAGVRNSNEFGRAAFYAAEIAAQGFVGLICGNTRPLLAAPGATAQTHGNNPLAFTAPGRDAPDFDASFTPRAGGEILRRRMLGLPLPEEWGYRDAAGNLTTDPAAAAQGVTPAAGGAKGFGIAVLVDLLSGALTGASSGPEVPLDNHDVGAFVLALDPDLFGAGERLEPAMQASAAAVRQAGGRWPGDRAATARAANGERGIVAVPRPIAEAALAAILEGAPAGNASEAQAIFAPAPEATA